HGGLTPACDQAATISDRPGTMSRVDHKFGPRSSLTHTSGPAKSSRRVTGHADAEGWGQGGEFERWHACGGAGAVVDPLRGGGSDRRGGGLAGAAARGQPPWPAPPGPG